MNAQKKYPYVIYNAFRKNKKKCEIFLNTARAYESGRHILELSPLYISNLQRNINTRQTALANFFKSKDVLVLQIDNLNAKAVKQLSNYLYNAIIKGINIKLEKLDLGAYISTEKIINAGNVMRNYDGIKTYGGSTIRDFITHTITTKKQPKFKNNNMEQANMLVSEFKEKLKDYNAIKSIPFSIFGFTIYIRVNKNKEIVVPDIEAKDNLRKIIGNEAYEKYDIKNIPLITATGMETVLIKRIRKTLDVKLKDLALNFNDIISEKNTTKLKHHISICAKAENVSVITDSGLIMNIAEYFKNNLNKIIQMDKNRDKKLSDEDKKALFQIEYTAMKNDTTPNSLWLSEILAAINGKYATFEKLLLCIEYDFAPVINDISVMDADVPYKTLKDFYETYVKNGFDNNYDEIMEKLAELIAAGS